MKKVLCIAFCLLLVGCSEKVEVREGYDKTNCHLIDEDKFEINTEYIKIVEDALVNTLNFEAARIFIYFGTTSIKNYDGDVSVLPAPSISYISQKPNMGLYFYGEDDYDNSHLYVEDKGLIGTIRDSAFMGGEDVGLIFESDSSNIFTNSDGEFSLQRFPYAEYKSMLEDEKNISHIEKNGDVYTVIFSEHYFEEHKKGLIEVYEEIKANSNDEDQKANMDLNIEHVLSYEDEYFHVDFKIVDGIVVEMKDYDHYKSSEMIFGPFNNRLSFFKKRFNGGNLYVIDSLDDYQFVRGMIDRVYSEFVGE